jgi:hypothetical protein
LNLTSFFWVFPSNRKPANGMCAWWIGGEFNLLFVIRENLGLIKAFGPQKFDPYSSKY